MPKRPPRLTPEAIATFPVIGGDPQIDPAGTTVAYVRAAATRDGTRLARQDLWLVDVDGGRDRQLTRGPRADLAPRWSPDGRRIAFLSDRLADGKLQPFCIDVAGGEAWRVAEIAGEIDASTGRSALQWSPDGRFLAFLARDAESDDEKKKREARDDARVHEEPRGWLRLWTLEVATGKLAAVSRDGVQVWGFDWSPDGKRFAAVVSDAPFEWSWYRSRLALLPAAGGKARTLVVPDQDRQLAGPRWSPDSRRIAYLSQVWSDRGVHQGGAFVVASGGGTPRALAADSRFGFGCLEWLDPRRLLGAGHEEGQAALARLDAASGRMTRLWREPIALADLGWPRFTCDAARRHVVVASEGPRAPRTIHRFDLRRGGAAVSKPARLTRPQPDVRRYALHSQELVRWRGRDGLELSGVLLTPPGYRPGRRHPTIVYVHGGPTSMVPNAFLPNTLWGPNLAARGYVVFMPNFRGGAGFGVRFAESNVGDMGGEDFHDIDTGVDQLVARGIADPDRLGVGGWSYGGFMTCWIVTQTDRYRAAVMGAGIADWRSFHGTTEIHSWDAMHYAADPYERGGAFERFSGINAVSRVATPTLVLHGEGDRCVPPEQSYQFHRALRDRGVESELVLYPREGHAITERAHWLDLRRRIGEWYDRHLG